MSVPGNGRRPDPNVLQFRTHIRHCLEQHPETRLYVLVDGARYMTLENRLDAAGAAIRVEWLLAATELDEISRGGPALVEFMTDSDEASQLLDWLIERDQKSPLVSWLWSERSFEALSNHLKSHLFSRLPDGRMALFRYYNPIVRRSLEAVLDSEQRMALMLPLDRWQIWQPLVLAYQTYYRVGQEARHA
ncbi:MULTISPECIES: DUF4123 domain-containing protein [Pseudomonas]|jgi:hypothetical protein|uniref:DUF4123 domain-containing protein n=1 Tax=Pseudomonas TaxID=286 RepID=UPI0020A13FA8|nr:MULTISPECIES: DUF4123 domain-containing protein [Pseudomonas]MCP1478162.1 hypothetical protein [Pseudomonas chlororaphis]MCP1595486.1 hypothetical protein [Pseudomonas chlororaphis]WDH33066.1 DUF4123 domain-containing protein [Pseudomonas chlororaphis]WDH39150.1 DUF4123 domain-containing protein [Pseudomonas chlororaphis]WPO48076.1 DUF4123 domain-containing protein [Pseudomonas sp. S1Bt23]